MKLSDLIIESKLSELRAKIPTLLAESLSEYLAVTLSKLKNKKSDELFKDEKNPLVDLDRLATYITGLKILGNSQYRSAITKDDIGINPGDVTELFKLLDTIPKEESKIVKEVDDVFDALKSLSPAMFKKERERLDSLKDDESPEKEDVIKKLSAFSLKINQIFSKSKQATVNQQKQLAQIT